MYNVVLFDLDGTITDSGSGITNSVVYALKKWNIEVADKAELYPFIGPPLQESFERFFHFSEEEAKKAVEYYREYYRDKGIFENEVYAGVEELLKKIKESGRKIILATSKPKVFAVRILEHFHLAQYFDFVSGASMDGVRCEKIDVIQHALKECGVKELEKVVMVGDRKHDILGAKAAGIDSIGVLFGFGDYEELCNAGATYIVEDVASIFSLL